MTRSMILPLAILLASPCAALRRCPVLQRLWLPALHSKSLPIGLRRKGSHNARVYVQMRGLLPPRQKYPLQAVRLPLVVLLPVRSCHV